MIPFVKEYPALGYRPAVFKPIPFLFPNPWVRNGNLELKNTVPWPFSMN